MSENKINKRNPMVADTEPTDEELELVMHEALALANTRKAASDAWMHQQLNQAVAEAFARDKAS